MTAVGFRIHTRVRRPARALLDRFDGLAAADLGDAMRGFNLMDAGLVPIVPGRILGSALTVRVRAGDNLMIHKALDLAEPGDVLVVDGRGGRDNALAGENVVLWAQKRGVVGLIFDGAIRDVEALRDIGLPIYARGVTPAAPARTAGGEVNLPIACGGVVVTPGDVIVADADGIAVVPRRDAEDVLAATAGRPAAEARAKAGIAAGDWRRPDVTDEAVLARGCLILDTVHDEDPS